MSDLQNQTPADTYKGLLQVGDYTNGVDSTSKYVSDGEGTPSALSISESKVGVGTTSPSAELDVNGDIEATTLNTSGAVTGGSVSTSGAVTAGSVSTSGQVGAGSVDVSGNIVADGKVGIGTSPISKLHIAGDDTNLGGLLIGHAVQAGIDSLRFYIDSNNKAHITRGTLEKMTIDSDGNVGIGTMTFGSNAAGVIGIGNATAPTDSPTDMVQLYAENVSLSSELRVRDEAGNVTTLSPHAKDAPDSLYDNGKGVDEMHRSANHYLGTITFTNVDRRNDLLQKQLNGEELPEDRTFTLTETFAEYNARTGADLQVEDWDANQQAIFDAQEEKVVARQAEIDAWDNEEEPPEPLESYVKKPKPDWLN